MNHMWVKLAYTPIDIEVDDAGALNIYASEAAIEIAEEDAIYLCWNCFTHLTVDTHGTDCDGPQNS